MVNACVAAITKITVATVDFTLPTIFATACVLIIWTATAFTIPTITTALAGTAIRASAVFRSPIPVAAWTIPACTVCPQC